MKNRRALLMMAGVVCYMPWLSATDFVFNVHVEAWTTGEGAQTLGHANGTNKVTAVNISPEHVNLVLRVEARLRHYSVVACSGNPSGQIGTCLASAVLKSTNTSAQCTNTLSNQGVPGSFRSLAGADITGGATPLLGEEGESNCPSVMPNFGF